MQHEPVWNTTERMFAEWATAQGWAVTKRGWPDFICRRGDEVMAVEVKGGNDSVRPEQAQTHKDLRDAGLPTFVWWPERGLLTTGPVNESVATLRAENKRLLEALADMIGIRDKLVSLPPPAHRSLTDVHDVIISALFTASNRCIEGHPEHQEWYSAPAGGLAFCGWVLQLSMRLSHAEIAEVTGVPEKQISRLVPRLQRGAIRMIDAARADAA